MNDTDVEGPKAAIVDRGAQPIATPQRAVEPPIGEVADRITASLTAARWASPTSCRRVLMISRAESMIVWTTYSGEQIYKWTKNRGKLKDSDKFSPE
jgi:hypothetical protein